jgi:hypothetical protein
LDLLHKINATLTLDSIVNAILQDRNLKLGTKADKVKMVSTAKPYKSGKKEKNKTDKRDDKIYISPQVSGKQSYVLPF